MFGIGFPELLLILAIALMVIGPKRLPEIAKALGRALGEFRRATDEFKNSIREETRVDDLRKQIQDSVNPPAKAPYPDQSGPAAGERAAPLAGVNPPPERRGAQAADPQPAPQPADPATPETRQEGSQDA